MAGFVTNIASAFVLYKVIKHITTDWNEWPAYNTGVIDENGNILVKSFERNSEQRESFGLFERFCLNLKRILGYIPGGNSKFATYGAALYLLLKEYKELNSNSLQSFLIENKDMINILIESEGGTEENHNIVHGYHWTSKRNADNIKNNGFKETPHIGPYGQGVHLSTHPTLFKTSGSTRLKVPLHNIKKIYRVNDNKTRDHATNNWKKLRDEGHDAIVVGNKGKESEIVVFDHKKVKPE